jgi:predicted transcriptional regulator
MRKPGKNDMNNELKEGMVRASIVLDREVHATLRVLSFRMEQSVSSMIREALDQWLRRNAKAAKILKEEEALRNK